METLNAPSAQAVLKELERLLVAQSKPAVTLRKLARDYVDLHALPHKKTAKRDIAYIKTKILPAFGDVPLSTINKATVQRWFIKLSGSAPISANRTLEVLSKMFECAIDWDYFQGPNPCKRIKPNPETKRERFLSRTELERLNVALNHEPPDISVLFRLYLLTGCRKDELLHAKWKQLDIGRGVLRLPTTKNGKPFDVKLSKAAIRLLNTLPKNDGFIFAGIRAGSVVAVDKAWRRIRNTADIKDVTIHDLRRTTASYLAALGTPHKTISRLLNHASFASTERYIRVEDHQAQAACERLAAFLDREGAAGMTG